MVQQTDFPDVPLLSVDNLAVEFRRDGVWQRAVNGVSFQVRPGERLALVGESGSGKSVTALSLLKLLPEKTARYASGAVSFEGRDVLRLPAGELRRLRGRDVAMVFQEPMTSLNPVLTIGRQLIEPLQLHEGLGRKAAEERAASLLDRMGIDQPRQRLSAYPHMLSGGQRQRVMIAMALACNPRLLVADEPTTALDVTVQWQILRLLDELQRDLNIAVILISHDLNLVRYFAQRVCVMREGNIVEQARVEEVFDAPKHEYTRRLLASRLERMVADSPQADAPNVLSGEGIRCRFVLHGGVLRRQVSTIDAVDNVDIAVQEGETLGIVGESGSGKSTLAHCLLRLRACEGKILFAGQRLDSMGAAALRPLRARMQLVFQDPYSSLSPRMRVENIVGEGLLIHQPTLSRVERRRRVAAILAEVGLGDDALGRYPHEFSGGQRQRIAIARAMILEPKVVILDEPTSALDATVQKQVLELLVELQRKRGLTYLLITHDLNVIRAVAHRVLVMKGGQLVETGQAMAFLTEPQTEYGRTLLRASFVDA